MAQFINQQNLAAMLNPQTANLGQLIGAPLAQGIMAGGQQDREDRLLGEQQQAQQQALQDKENTQREAAFSASLLGLSDDELPIAIQQGVSSGGFNQDFIDELSQLSAMGGQRDKLITSTLQSEGFGSLVPKRDESSLKNLSEIRKETRARVGSEVKDINKTASVITSNYNKIQNLAGEVKKGNRTSVAQAIVAMVKLGDPGSTVLEGEIKSALNNENAIAAVTSALSNKGTSQGIIDSVLRSVDPLSPETVNVGDIINTANALVSANIGPIQERFSEVESLAADNLTAQGVSSLFPKGLKSRIGSLSSVIKPYEAVPQRATTTSAAVQPVSQPANSIQPQAGQPQSYISKSGIEFTVEQQ